MAYLRRDATHKRRLAFSLMEVLVVVGIVAIVLAILFPVFHAAKRSAVVTQDIAQMKQVYLAIELYRSDSDTEYPASFADIARSYAHPRIMSSPADKRLAGADGMFPANRYVDLPMDLPENTRRADVRISYAYLRPFHNRFPTPGSWDLYTGDPRWAVLACGDYLELRDPTIQPFRNEHGSASDSGKWIRIMMDGALKRAEKTNAGISIGGSYEEIFHY